MLLLGRLLGWVFGGNSPGPSVVLDRSQRLANQRAWGAAAQGKAKAVRASARNMRVTRVVRETADTLSLYLVPEDGQPVNFQAGQFLTFCFDMAEGEQRRAYSISSMPGSPELRVTVKRVKDGQVSSYIHEKLKEGDLVRTFGPSGSFCLPEQLERALFIAGGSGITPVRAMLETLLERQPEVPVTLLYASRNLSQVIFRRELEDLATRWPNLTVQHVLSRPGTRWQGIRGRMTAEQVGSVAEPLEGTRYFLCGPTGLASMAEEALLAAGVSRDQILTEHFLHSPRLDEELPRHPQTVHLQQAGQTLVAQPGQTLLEAALEAGVELPYSCQVGGCGHCRVKVLQGAVITREPNCLSDEERTQGYRLACQSYACSEVWLDA